MAGAGVRGYMIVHADGALIMNDPVQKITMVGEYSASELLELGRTFKK